MNEYQISAFTLNVLNRFCFCFHSLSSEYFLVLFYKALAPSSKSLLFHPWIKDEAYVYWWA